MDIQRGSGLVPQQHYVFGASAFKTLGFFSRFGFGGCGIPRTSPILMFATIQETRKEHPGKSRLLKGYETLDPEA